MKIDLKAGSEVATFRLDGFAANPYSGVRIVVVVSAFLDGLVPWREDVMSGIRVLDPRYLSSPLRSDNREVEMRVRRITIPDDRSMDVCDTGVVVVVGGWKAVFAGAAQDLTRSWERSFCKCCTTAVMMYQEERSNLKNTVHFNTEPLIVLVEQIQFCLGFTKPSCTM